MNYTTKSGHRLYSTELNGRTVYAYKDGCEFVVRSDDHFAQRFDDRKWTMSAAMKFYGEIWDA